MMLEESESYTKVVALYRCGAVYDPNNIIDEIFWDAKSIVLEYIWDTINKKNCAQWVGSLGSGVCLSRERCGRERCYCYPIISKKKINREVLTRLISEYGIIHNEPDRLSLKDMGEMMVKHLDQINIMNGDDEIERIFFEFSQTLTKLLEVYGDDE